MLTGFRVLWRALIHFWDESLLMIRANVTWFVISLPLYLLTVLVCGFFIPPIDPESGENIWPWVMSAFILVTIPGPTSVGVYAVANFVVNEETPEFSLFWRAIKLLWKKALAIYLIGAAVLGVANAVIKPVLTVLTLPLIIVTLGFSYLLLNIAMLALAEWIATDFSIDGFWTYVGATIVVWLVNWFLNAVIGGFLRDD
jgi:putative membrane protein